ncbi:MAG: MATE family efflux transporter [Clostridia bacterium]|nr:MATE family efflux transporter [Clostridia bacterium]
MRQKRGVDMTRGPIMRQVALFALPLCLGSILQLLYSTVDSIVIGNFCGASSLAAVGTSSQPIEVFMCLFMGVSSGITILVSQAVGKGDAARQRQLAVNTVFFLYLCALPVTLAGLVCGPLLLRLMAVPEDAFARAAGYIRIVFLGTLGNLGYNLNAGLLRGLGDSRATLRFLVISCAVNIALDLLFVALFRWDVTGAAAATAAAMYVSWLCSVAYLRRRYPELGFRLLPNGHDWSAVRDMARIGLPLALNHSVFSLGHMAMQTFVNMQGSAFMAACAIGSKINGFTSVTVNAFASATTSFAGQNLGAARYDRLSRGGRIIPLVNGGVGLAFGLLFMAFCRPLVSLFTRDPEVLAQGAAFVRAVLPFIWSFAVYNSVMSFSNGIGKVRYPMIVTILMLWAVRIPSAWLINRFWDGHMIIHCHALSFMFGMLAMLPFYLTKPWRDIREKGRAQGNA